MNQYKRRLHNQSVDVRHMNSSINQHKRSLEFKRKQSTTNKKGASPLQQTYNTHKIHFFKPSKEQRADLCKRFQTEKVSLAGSEVSVQKRKLSFGKSSDLKIMTRGKTPSSEVHFNQALEHIQQNNYKQAIKILVKLVEEKGSNKGNCYLWLAICYRKTGKHIEALQLLNMVLKQTPRNYEALTCRCKILIRLNRYDEALKDIETCISVDQNKGLAYVVKGDCLRMKQDFKGALDCYEKALDDSKSNHFQIEIKKLQLYMDTKQYSNLIQQADRLLKGYGPQSEVLAYKGLGQKQLGQLGNASLTFEQSLKYNNSKKGVSRSLYQLVKIKMQERDFYAAYHTISRSQHLNVDQTTLGKFKIFNEAAVFLMKRKFQEGLKLLDQVKGENIDQFINPLLKRFKAYALFCLGRHEEAIEYYEKLFDLDEGSQFNFLLCKGIVAVENNKYSQGIKHFNAAKKVFPTKVEPYIYIGTSLIKKGHTLDDFRRQELIMQGLQEINQGNTINDSNSNLLYHRSIIYYYLRDWECGLIDINRCVEKAEDNLPKYFYLRGLGYACTKDLVGAINEFSIGISLSKKFSACYLERAKCLFLLGDTQKAFQDLHCYVEMEPDDYHIHKWIGNLLYESRSYTDALKTFQEIQESNDTLIIKSKCALRLGLLPETKSFILGLNKSSVKYEGYNVDMSALNLLQSLVAKDSSFKLSHAVKQLNETLAKQQKGEVFKLLDCMTLIGTAAFYMGKYNEAYSSFDLAKQLYEGVSIDWKKPTVKSEVCQDHLDLDLHKLYFNLFLSLVGQGKIKEAINMLEVNLLQDADASQVSVYSKLLISNKKYEKSHINLIFSRKGQISHQFETVELPFNSMTIKAKPMYGIFHDDQSNSLYPLQKAQSLIKLLTPTYIQNKPEAPWIKRNPFGVIFTEDLLTGQSIQLDSTQYQQSQRNQTFQSPLENSLSIQLNNFKKDIQLDLDIEKKLQKLMKKGNKSS